MIECGIITTIASTQRAVVYAEAAEQMGFSRVGMADTAPKLFHATYPAVTAALMRTNRISIGPYVTNPVTRHWSVHAATARALQELAPGRFYVGMATGDGAVNSVGLKPSKLEYFENYIHEMRTIWPEQSKIHLAFSGPKGMELAGRVADELTVAVGLDIETIQKMVGLAKAARQSAGIEAPLRIWINPLTYVVPTESEVEPMRKALRNIAFSSARFSFDASMEDKNVPDHMKPILKERLALYDFAYKGQVGDNPNARLFEDHPEVENYLIDRAVLTGTAQQCVTRLEQLMDKVELSGVWFPTIPRTPHFSDHVSDLAALEKAFRPIMGN